MERNGNVEKPRGDESVPTGPPHESASMDAILSAVADEHRRAVLRALAGADADGMSLDDLVPKVAARVGDAEGELGVEHRLRVRTALHHNHLPTLAASELIEYDSEANQIHDRAGVLGEQLLSVVDSHDIEN